MAQDPTMQAIDLTHMRMNTAHGLDEVGFILGGHLVKHGPERHGVLLQERVVREEFRELV